MLKKLSSRKFWAMVAIVVTSAMYLFGYADDVITKVVALVTSFGAVIGYLFSEGSTDKERIKGENDIAVAKIVSESEIAKAEAITTMEVRSNEAAATAEPDEFANSGSNR